LTTESVLFIYGTSMISAENIYHGWRLCGGNLWRGGVGFFSTPENRVNRSVYRKSDVGNYNIVDNLRHLVAIINYYANFSYCIPSWGFDRVKPFCGIMWAAFEGTYVLWQLYYYTCLRFDWADGTASDRCRAVTTKTTKTMVSVLLLYNLYTEWSTKHARPPFLIQH